MSIADAALCAAIDRVVENGFPQHAGDRLAMGDVNVLTCTGLSPLPQRQQRRQDGVQASHRVGIGHGQAQRRAVGSPVNSERPAKGSIISPKATKSL